MVVTLQLSVSYLRRALTQTTKLCQGAPVVLHRSSGSPFSSCPTPPHCAVALTCGRVNPRIGIDQNVNEMLTPKEGQLLWLQARRRRRFPPTRGTPIHVRGIFSRGRVPADVIPKIVKWATSDTTDAASPGEVQKIEWPANA